MKIAVLSTTRNPLVEPFAGGQESMTATLISALRRRGHWIRVYAPAGTDPHLADELVAYPELPDLSMVALLDPQVPEPDFLSDHHCLTTAVAHLLQDATAFDVIHNQTLHHLPLSLAPLFGRPVVTTLHTPPFPWMELGAALAGDQARYVAVSRALAAQWTTLDPRPEVIPNGVDVARFDKGPGGTGLVWVGRLVPEKGADIAVRAARLAGTPLRLAGPIGDQDWFDHAVRPLLKGAAEYVGHLDHRETSTLLGQSAALLMTPRWEEPFGQVVVESALTGTPSVALRRGGLSEVVGPQLGVLVDPSPDERAVVKGVAAAITTVVRLDRDVVRAVSQERFSADRMAQDYEGIFNQPEPGA